ncbi:MAG: hypothetical protein FWC39_03465 [Bacteroidetes bacterium]|nr:hypothetical protein [Bacteroidota bacterium]
MRTLFIFSALFFLSIAALHAQYFSWGNERGSTKWQQIETEQFQVIYPQGYDSVAQRCTRILHYVYSAVGKTLEHKPAKISVILHTQSRISNGSVAWAPKRIDVSDVVSPTQTPDDWWESLILHEYRHVVQMDKLNEGMTRILYFLLGEQALGAVAGLYLPDWFMEGDAVVCETALGTAGRGRTADFSMGLRAQLAQKKQFSYAKAYFGSYRDFVPNSYAMGYVVVANARSLYNPYLFAKVVENVALRPLSIRPFDNALKAQTGSGKIKLYDTTFKVQALEWRLLREREIQKPFDTIISPAKKGFVNYNFTQQINDTQYIAERSGLANRRQLVLITTGEKRAKPIANTALKPANEAFSTNNKLVVWAETKPHIRWELTNYTYIYMYSLETKRKKKISTPMRLFAPAISPDGTQIVAVEIGATGTYDLVFYTIENKQWSKIPLPQGEYALAPTWNTDASKIAYVGVSSKGKRLVEYDVRTQSFNEILPHSTEDLRSPVYFKSYILYTSSYSGVDNVYAVHTENKQQWRVTVSEFGAQFPRVYGNKITFSDYSATGFCVGSLPAEPHRWHTINAVRKYSFPLATTLNWQENTSLNFAKMPDTVFSSRKYSKLAHLFNIHSWSPFYLDYSQNTTNFGIGAQLVSQNKLATAVSRFGYRATFDSSPKQVGFAAFRYTGFFPIIDIETEVGKQEIPIDSLLRVDFNIINSSAAISLPFNFSRNGFSRLFVLQTQLLHSYMQPHSSNFLTFSIVACKYAAVFSNMSSGAPRDLFPVWGQRLEIAYLHNPYSTAALGSDYVYSRVDLYFPSIFKNHSIHGAIAADWHANENALLFNREIFVPRGTETMIFQRKEMISTRLEYTLPLWYPDIAWRAVFYGKRLWTTAFFDYAYTRSKISNSTQNYTSYGFDLNAEMHLFHFRAPITAGVRTAFVQQTQKWSAIGLLSFNFGAM